ncbi:hypothetical protein C8J56DRAFT_898048 [Mycena floridula]|nr:hypothetical protein C8J56DRAFT_898048 [Mycena floridula]
MDSATASRPLIVIWRDSEGNFPGIFMNFLGISLFFCAFKYHSGVEGLGNPPGRPDNNYWAIKPLDKLLSSRLENLNEKKVGPKISFPGSDHLPNTTTKYITATKRSRCNSHGFCVPGT